MKLELPDGRAFPMCVERYEFPDEELGPHEDNPADEFYSGRDLFVRVTCGTPERTWQATQPEMDTTELERLADWFEKVQSGAPSRAGVYFTERDLEIGFDQTTQELVVYLFDRFRPPGSSEDITIRFPIDQIDLGAAIASIRAQLVQFPGRPLPGESR